MNPLEPEYVVMNEQGQLEKYGSILGNKPKKFTHLRSNPNDVDLSLKTQDIGGASPHGCFAKCLAAKSLARQRELAMNTISEQQPSVSHQKREKPKQLKATTPKALNSNRSQFLTHQSIIEEEEEE